MTDITGMKGMGKVPVGWRLCPWFLPAYSSLLPHLADLVSIPPSPCLYFEKQVPSQDFLLYRPPTGGLIDLTWFSFRSQPAYVDHFTPV